MTVGSRLAEERARLSLGVVELAEACGVTKKTQYNFEKDANLPGGDYLLRAASLGVDVQYALTGLRSANAREVAGMTIVVKGSQGITAGQNVNISGDVIQTQATPKIVTQFTPGPEHITEEQAARLKSLVDDIVSTESVIKKIPLPHAAVWSALNRKFRVASYIRMPRSIFEAAETYLQQWLGRLRSARSAPRKLGALWRKKRYSGIHARVRQYDWGTGWFRPYLKERFGAESLTELSDQDLETAYRTVMNKKP